MGTVTVFKDPTVMIVPDLFDWLVEPGGIEPPTSTLPVLRSPS